MLSLSGDEELKCTAVGVLSEVVSKRMEPEAKLALIQQLGVVPLCAGWRGQLPVQAYELDLAARYAELLCIIMSGCYQTYCT